MGLYISGVSYEVTKLNDSIRVVPAVEANLCTEVMDINLGGIKCVEKEELYRSIYDGEICSEFKLTVCNPFHVQQCYEMILEVIRNHQE